VCARPRFELPVTRTWPLPGCCPWPLAGQARQPNSRRFSSSMYSCTASWLARS
jgi:hypothetical protein